MSLDREKAKRILDEAYASGKLNRSIIEPDHNEPLGVTDNRCNWCGEPDAMGALCNPNDLEGYGLPEHERDRTLAAPALARQALRKAGY